MTNDTELLARIQELEAQLATAHAEQWKLIRDVCHELRLPLTSMKGYTDLMPLIGPINDQQKDFVSRIKKNITRMSGMITNLHDLAYMGEGKFKLKPKELPTAQLVQEVCDEMQLVAKERQNTLRCDLPGDLPHVYADEERAKQSLRIMIENACWYTPAGGQATVNAEASGDSMVKISVSDTGVGVPEAERAKLFSLFFRADLELVRGQAGAGMNLYMLRRFVELMGGSYGADFAAEGGSRFWVCLPAR
ncbi:MAG: HAMP domain-containing histidine kinase [Thermoflexales bacterium]|nr:HAMP domain-containing histidine kinase [Thermoflexales bacterium]